jgi:hypothetical protein
MSGFFGCDGGMVYYGGYVGAESGKYRVAAVV